MVYPRFAHRVLDFSLSVFKYIHFFLKFFIPETAIAKPSKIATMPKIKFLGRRIITLLSKWKPVSKRITPTKQIPIAHNDIGNLSSRLILLIAISLHPFFKNSLLQLGQQKPDNYNPIPILLPLK